MTDNKKIPPKRAPRRRGKAKSQTRSPDEAKSNPGQVTATPAPSHAPELARNEREAKSREQQAPTRTLAAIPMHVRWRDLDAFNHVNNSSYLTYLEESRLQWLRKVPGEWFTEHAMPVMAAVELRYRRPIEWPAEIDVLLSCERLGNSSMTIGNRIVDRNDHACVYADGNVVMVWVDPATGAAVPLPSAIRAACATYS
ncbi:MAG: acyl-CoA thioesterase [Rhodanobacteraceae bacterium]